jgi:hypothetical protein
MRPLPGIFRLAAVAAIALSPTVGGAADPDFIPIKSPAETPPAISKCLRQDKEAVLFSDGVHCKAYHQGWPFLKEKAPDTPFDFDLTRDCPKEPSESFDARRLSADAIQQLMNEAKARVGPAGIRILGAVFCESVKLVGIELPFSLVLDNSVFARGVEMRNLRTKGDLSLDRSLVFDHLTIIRSQIEGSFFGDKSFVQNLSIGNSTINTSASFTESVLFESAQIYNSSVARELSIRGSALSYFITQFSNIGGVLDLSHSEARCAYHVNKSEIGYLVAKGAGFGTVVLENGADKTPGYYVWRGDNFTRPVDHVLSNSEVKKRVRADTCTGPFSRPHRAQFFIFDSNVKSSLCVNEFRWLGPRDAGPYVSDQFFRPMPGAEQYLRTIVAINGNTIGSNLIVDLWPKNADRDHLDYKVSKRLHRLEIIGVKAGGLAINFDTENESHFTTAVDGLQFDRLYSAHASCEYGGSDTAPPIYDDRTLSIISDFTETLELPKVEDALKWLDLNTIESTQPYTAFATAFRNAGVDGTPITVARENRELCERAARWLPLVILRQFCRDAAERREGGVDESSKYLTLKPQFRPVAPEGGWSELGTTLMSIPSQLSDFALLGFHGGLYFLADHGYRPAKVLWWVTLTLLGFWAWFLWPLKVVAYASKKGSPPSGPALEDPDIRPIGFLFLFDRLLPAYQIDPAHYEIEKYFRRIAVANVSSIPFPPPLVRRLLFIEWPVEQVTDRKEIARIENSLRLLRILGVVFAIFLAAAVSAMVIH